MNAAERRADYQARKESGRCIERRCAEAAADGSLRCARHDELHRHRQRMARRRQRRRLAAAGLCVACQRPSATYRCPACLVRQGLARLRPTTSVNASVVDQGKGPKDTWRLEPGTNWKRYRGRARQGSPAAAVLDDQDLAQATRELARAKEALAYARSAEVQALGSIARREVLRAALGRLEIVQRWLGEVIARHLRPPRAVTRVAGP
jgi:hypothetical protein